MNSTMDTAIVIDIGVFLTSNVLHIWYKITQEQKRTQVWECIFFNVFVYCTGINVQNLILGFIWQPQEERTLCKFGMNTWSTVQSHFPAWPREQFLKSRDSREAGPVHVVFKSRAHPEEEQWKYSSFLSHFFSQIRISGKILVLTKPHGSIVMGIELL